jgi:hypothetical protein
MAGFGLGVDVAPISLLPGQSLQPTGPALIDLLARDHLTVVRLLDSSPTPGIAQAQALAAGGWKTAFGELHQAGIRAVLLVRVPAVPTAHLLAARGPPAVVGGELGPAVQDEPRLAARRDRRSRLALDTTDSEESAMAAAAITGERTIPKNG